jgi:hypothetical protein
MNFPEIHIEKNDKNFSGYLTCGEKVYCRRPGSIFFHVAIALDQMIERIHSVGFIQKDFLWARDTQNQGEESKSTSGWL